MVPFAISKVFLESRKWKTNKIQAFTLTKVCMEVVSCIFPHITWQIRSFMRMFHYKIKAEWHLCEHCVNIPGSAVEFIMSEAPGLCPALAALFVYCNSWGCGRCSPLCSFNLELKQRRQEGTPALEDITPWGAAASGKSTLKTIKRLPVITEILLELLYLECTDVFGFKALVSDCFGQSKTLIQV